MSTVVVATVKSNSSSPPTFQNTSGTEIGTLCRAWVNFNGTGVTAIRASLNVSSITDGGTGGPYTINFINAMPDTNYATIMSSGQRSATTIDYGFSGGYSSTTTSTRVFTWGVSTSAVDWDTVQVAIFR